MGSVKIVKTYKQMAALTEVTEETYRVLLGFLVATFIIGGILLLTYLFGPKRSPILIWTAVAMFTTALLFALHTSHIARAFEDKPWTMVSDLIASAAIAGMLVAMHFHQHFSLKLMNN